MTFISSLNNAQSTPYSYGNACNTLTNASNNPSSWITDTFVNLPGQLPSSNTTNTSSIVGMLQNFTTQMMTMVNQFVTGMYSLFGINQENNLKGMTPIPLASDTSNISSLLGMGNSTSGISNILGGPSSGISNIFSQAPSLIGGLFGNNGSSSIIGDSGFSFSNIWDGIKNIFSGLFSSGSSSSSNVICEDSNSSGFSLSNIFGGIKDMFSGLFSSGSSSGGSCFSNIFSGIGSFFSNIFS